MGYSLAELIDIEKVKKLLSSFYNITGIPSALNDRKGNNLISVGWRKICSDFHLSNPVTKSKCLHSTIVHDFSENLKGQRYVSYKCPNGLQEIAAPIIVDGIQLGTILQGQFFYHKPNLTFFQKQAKKYGFDENAYLEGVKAVPIITEKEIEPIIYFLCDLSEMMAKQGLTSLSELKLKKELEIREERFSLALKSSEYEVWDWDIENHNFHFGLNWWLKNGYSIKNIEQEIIDLNQLQKFMHQADILFWEKTLFNCLCGRFKILDREVRLKNKANKWRWVHIKGKVIDFDSSGKALRMIGTYNDITDIKNTQEALQEQFHLLKTLMNAIPNPVFYKNKENIYLECNPAFLDFLDLKKENVIGKKENEIFKMNLTKDDNLLYVSENDSSLRSTDELEIIKLNGQKSDIILNKAAFYKNDGSLSGIVGVMTDISKQKAKEDEIRYLSLHDSLTGLYNRAFFEKKVLEFNNYPIDSISVVMGDMNGLKLTNDVFGHFAGDQLIKKCANILLSASKENYIVARWGGDEFAIIIPDAGEKEAADFCERVNNLCLESPRDPIQPSIAIFYATKKSDFQDLHFLIKEAETGMYRAKMICSREVRSSMLFALENSLFTSNPHLRKHCENLINYANFISVKVGLKEDDKEKLVLLARFHDIGKIVLNPEILKKKEALTKEESEQLRIHCEIGYRVAESIDELTSISQLILSHHERWDGTGYPYGLSGEKIPYLARWMTILDTYEVMLNKIPFGKIITKIDVLMEMKQEAGLKYDPKIIEDFIACMT